MDSSATANSNINESLKTLINNTISPSSSSAAIQQQQQPSLKLFSSLANMVNNVAAASVVRIKTTNTATSALLKQPKPNLVSIPKLTNNQQQGGIRPMLYHQQVPVSSSSAETSSRIPAVTKATTMSSTTFPQHMTHAQLLELQKTILASKLKAAATNKESVGLQISGTTVTVNTKLPVLQTTTTTNRQKSAFMQHQRNNAARSSQVHITPLLQQQKNTFQSTNPLLGKTKSQLTAATLNNLHSNTMTPTLKSFAEQIKALTQKQREILVKQYTASGKLSLPQLQSALANTDKPVVLASILKNRQVVPTAVSFPTVPQLKTISSTQGKPQLTQSQKKPAKVFLSLFFVMLGLYRL